MNWVDIVVIAVIVVSAMLAFMRGFVREVLGVGSWIAAAVFAIWAFPLVRERFHLWIGSPDFADLAAFGAMFLIALIVLSVLAGMVSGLVRLSMLGGIDRTLGVVFGVARGAALVVVAYIGVGMVVAIDHWPKDVQEARSLPYAYQGSLLAVSLLPLDYRPTVRIPPPSVDPKADDLLHATPQGRAVARP